MTQQVEHGRRPRGDCEAASVRLVVAGFLLVAAAVRGATAEESGTLLTVAEKSDFTRTASHAEVVEYVEKLAASSDSVHLTELGRSAGGKSLPLIILSDRPVRTPADAAATGKPVALLIGNIHGGEVCGKEALLMLARDIGTSPSESLLEHLVIAIVPVYNPDGNDRFGPGNRARQNGPAEGVGVRPNAQGLDLNRDYIKLEAPETRALVRFLNEWDPLMTIDTHTTNGSYHRYQLTYAGPKNPAGDRQIIEFTRDELLPEVTRRLRSAPGFETYVYGNFRKDHTLWETYPAWARYGTPYRGLRNRVAILSEAYAYATYRERVLATRDFVGACLEFLAEKRQRIRELAQAADSRTIEAGKNPRTEDEVAIVSRAVSAPEKVEILGFVEETRDGKVVATGDPRSYEVDLIDRFEPKRSVRRPYAYLFPSDLVRVAHKLQEHGVELETLREDIELDLEVYRVEVMRQAEVQFEGHRLREIEVSSQRVAERVAAGTTIVRTAQRLGSLAVYLLEAESEDGLCRWNFLDDHVAVGEPFPIRRVTEPVPLTSSRIPAPSAAERRPVTFEAAFTAVERPRFSGSAVSSPRWLDDGEHFFQRKEGRLWRVEARTGKCEEVYDAADLAARLARLPSIDAAAARAVAERRWLDMDPTRAAFVFDHENDLYYYRWNGEMPLRLTSTPEKEELFEFSPDGRFVSFVLENDLWVVDVDTATSRALTAGGRDTLRRGKSDWVYFEEVFGRDWKAYWWSPDSGHIAFLEIDSGPVGRFTLVDDLARDQRLEVAPYPRPGEPNPRARVGVVSAAGGDVRWVDLSDYDVEDVLVTGCGWWPDGETLYCFLQNRTQTWLDFCAISVGGSTRPRRLFRDTTAAWVSAPPAPLFLSDGSFLITSERTGWNHVVHYARDGDFKGAVTSGAWEVRRVHRVDADEGVVYVSGRSDSHLGEDLYRVRLDGSARERLTSGEGVHRVHMSPRGELFIDRFSSRTHPPRVALCDTKGTLVRWIDTNPVEDLKAYEFGVPELLKIPARDGFLLEASLLKPPGFRPQERYPVWFMTYGGPQAPTVRDAWRGRAWDQVLAQEGLLVLRCDPRSASGKGAASAWTAYRRLGVQESQDVVDALRWVKSQPYVDPTRVGMSGHSYGGFLTAYTMTHSDELSAGIAGAPVTDWRDYDTIYTERYMGTPQENPDGYRATSVVEAADRLHGRLLLLHGTMDDNVHLQNTYRLVDALQRAGKRFELMVYPGARHGIFGDHYLRLKLDFIRRTLLTRDEASPLSRPVREPQNAPASPSGR